MEAYTLRLGYDGDRKDPCLSPLHAPAEAFPPGQHVAMSRTPCTHKIRHAVTIVVRPDVCAGTVFLTCTVQTGDCDPLLPGMQKLVEKLRMAGNDVEEFITEGVGHGWERMVKPGDEKFERLRDEALAYFVARLQKCWTT